MSYPWIKDGQYVTPQADNYLAVTAPNGLYLPNGVAQATIIAPASVTSLTFNGALTGNATSATRATNIAGGLVGQIPYQSAVNTTAFLAAGTSGQFLQSNATGAPTWVNQNLAATASGITTGAAVSGTDTLTANFNNSFSSVTNYTVNFVNTSIGASTVITRTINGYALSGGVAGGQYTLVIQLVIAGNAGTTFIFNGNLLSATHKSNFTNISTGSVNGGTRYVVLTFAYDGTNYFMSGSNFA